MMCYTGCLTQQPRRTGTALTIPAGKPRGRARQCSRETTPAAPDKLQAHQALLSAWEPRSAQFRRPSPHAPAHDLRVRRTHARRCPLARLELEIALSTLFRRMPGLALTEQFEALDFRY